MRSIDASSLRRRATSTRSKEPSWPARTASVPTARSRSASRPTRSSGSTRSPGYEQLPVQPQGAAREPAAHRGRREHHRRPHPGARRWDPDGRARHRDPVHAGPRDHAGLHRRALRRRPRHHARGRRATSAATRPRSTRSRPAELVIDHSVIADLFGTDERLRAQRRARVRAQRRALPVPALGPDRVRRLQGRPAGHRHRAPGQHRAPGPRRHDREVDGVLRAYPDTCVGTDSHTTMVNGLGVLGWGVGGIEAEAAMLGQPVSMLIPRVVGFKLTGAIPTGVTATDVVLTITEMLRKHGVVGKFVEFYGEGVAAVPLANRATIGNMSPEFGSTAAIFPIDDVTLDYLRLTGRSDEQVALVEAYAKEQGLWHDADRRAGLQRVPRARPRRRSCRRSPARSARRTASCCRDAKAPVRERPPQLRRRRARPRRLEGVRVVPGLRPARQLARRRVQRARAPPPQPRAGHGARSRRRSSLADGEKFDARPRRRRDRRDHLLHQHVEPVGHARRRPARQEGRREGPDAQAVGQDHAGAGLEGRHRLLREGRPDAVPREARLLPGRLRLHHLHRQLRPAASTRSRRPSTRTTSPSPRCSRATATSRAASTPT